MALGAEYFDSILTNIIPVYVDSKTYNINHILGTKNPHDSDSGSGSDTDDENEQQQGEVRLLRLHYMISRCIHNVKKDLRDIEWGS